MNKKYIVGLVIVIIAVLIGYIIFHNSQNQNSNSINLGVILPLTGSGADQGEWVKRGM